MQHVVDKGEHALTVAPYHVEQSMSTLCERLTLEYLCDGSADERQRGTELMANASEELGTHTSHLPISVCIFMR